MRVLAIAHVPILLLTILNGGGAAPTSNLPSHPTVRNITEDNGFIVATYVTQQASVCFFILDGQNITHNSNGITFESSHDNRALVSTILFPVKLCYKSLECCCINEGGMQQCSSPEHLVHTLYSGTIYTLLHTQSFTVELYVLASKMYRELSQISFVFHYLTGGSICTITGGDDQLMTNGTPEVSGSQSLLVGSPMIYVTVTVLFAVLTTSFH